MIYLYITPSGSVNLQDADKMPVYPKAFSADDEIYNDALKKNYALELQAAKASSIPCSDQERAKTLIWKSGQDLDVDYHKDCNEGKSCQKIGICHSVCEMIDDPKVRIKTDTIYGPFDIGYRKDRKKCEGCGVSDDADCKRSPGHCEFLLEDIAILLPETDEDPIIHHKGKEHKFKLVPESVKPEEQDEITKAFVELYKAQKDIPSEIQRIINDRFFDML
jgi:hypothetical protein